MTDGKALMFVLIPLCGFASGGWDGALAGVFVAGVLYVSLRAMASRDLPAQFSGWCTALGGVGGVVFGGGVESGVGGLLIAQLFLWVVAQVVWYCGDCA